MGDSDDDGEEDFEGFTLQEIVKGDESDIDLDIVVQNQELIRQFSLEISSSSDLNQSGSGGEELLEANDADLPGVAGPSKAKMAKTVKEKKRCIDHVMVSPDVESATRKSVPGFC